MLIFITGGEGAGQAEYTKEHYPGAEVLGNYHMTVKEQLEKGADPLQEAEARLCSSKKSDRDLVIWTCETGCGLVPADAFQRRWREVSGRVNCLIAGKADTVIRMICGRADVIKSHPRAEEHFCQSVKDESNKAFSDRNSQTAVKKQPVPVENSSVLTNKCGKTGNKALTGKARPVMVVGTMSNAGKSFIAAGLCRIFADDGYSVAPFKAQNMALNSFITKKGEEMGRSQVVQAEACRKEPDARMNPILLKPTTDKGSQIIINGHPIADMDAKEYYRHKNEFLPYVKEAYDSLASENDIIVLEGAGSPAEINLKENDIVNMPMAAMVNAPVILVGNIDPGGVFAQLYGTLKLLEPEEQDRIAGMIINKFRGDLSILEPGIGMLEEKTGKKVLGVLPYTDVRLEPEDSLAMEEWERSQKEQTRTGSQKEPAETGRPGKRTEAGCHGEQAEAGSHGTAAEGSDPENAERGVIDIAVIRLPKISNFTDLEALRLEPDVRLRYIRTKEEFGTPDVIILPGTKSTIADLLWLRQNGLETMIRRAHDAGAFLAGICGGYQMLGTVIRDPDGAETAGETDGLGYLDMATVFAAEKIMRQTETVSSFGIPAIDGKKITGYEVHMGRGEEARREPPGLQTAEKAGSAVGEKAPERNGSMSSSEDGTVIGTYIHGLFDEEEFRDAFLAYICRRKSAERHTAPGKKQTYREFREQQLCDLADMMRKNLDIAAIYRIMGLEGRTDQQ